MNLKKNEEKFWEERKLARGILDRKRNKKRDAKRLCLDRKFLKTGIVI